MVLIITFCIPVAHYVEIWWTFFMKILMCYSRGDLFYPSYPWLICNWNFCLFWIWQYNLLLLLSEPYCFLRQSYFIGKRKGGKKWTEKKWKGKVENTEFLCLNSPFFPTTKTSFFDVLIFDVLMVYLACYLIWCMVLNVSIDRFFFF